MISAGLGTREGGVNRTALMAAMEAGEIDKDRWGKTFGVKAQDEIYPGAPHEYDMETLADALAKAFERAVAKPMYDMMADVYQPFRMTGVMDAPAGTGKRGDVKVTINRIEVVSDDPDRFAFGLDELVQTAASRRGITPGYLPTAWQKG